MTDMRVVVSCIPGTIVLINRTLISPLPARHHLLWECLVRIMTEKNPWLSMAAPRCALDIWKCMHRDNIESTNQTTNQNLHPVGMRRVQTADHACANFHLFPDVVDSSPRHPPRPLPPSRIPFDLFSRATPGLFFTFHRRRWRLRVSASSPSTEGFSQFFSPRVYPTLETSRDGGGGNGGRPEGAAVGIGTQPRQFSYRTT